MHLVLFRLSVALVCMGVSLVAVSADKVKTGSIQGSVNFCNAGGVEGMQIYIPGLPYLVITGKSGQFQLLGLPEGKYDVHYRVGENLLNRNPGVHVSSGLATDLSMINFCNHAKAMPAVKSTSATDEMPVTKACGPGSVEPSCQDADGDGVMADQDCDDKNAATYPGAVEICDGIDNNCNNKVDENALVVVFGGVGICESGKVAVKSCKEGFGNCDGLVENGCEVDTKNEVEHCGACNEECTPTELCIAGGCE